MARPKLGESETERLHLKITADEVTAIDDWRFANRVPSRSEAVRRLCQIAILLGPLVNDLKSLWEDAQQANTSLNSAVYDAYADLDKISARELLEAIDGPLKQLIPTSLNLGVHALTMQEVLDRLTSGDDLKDSIDDLKMSIGKSSQVREFTSKRWGDTA